MPARTRIFRKLTGIAIALAVLAVPFFIMSVGNGGLEALGSGNGLETSGISTAETSETTEATEATETSETSETTEAAETSKTSEIPCATETSAPPDPYNTSEATETTEAAGTTEPTEAYEAFGIGALGVGSDLEHAQSFCPFMMLTGLPCPGCGLTKSLVCLYRGDLWGSLTYHILGLPVAVVCLFLIVLLSVELATGGEYFNRLIYSRTLGYILAGALAAFHLVRLVVYIAHNSLCEILHRSIWA